MIEYSTGRADHDVRALLQRAKLAINRLSAVNRHDAQAGVFRQIVNAARDLNRQFARRCENESLRFALACIEFLDDRQRERGGFAGSGLRLTDDVAALQQKRNRARLNRRRRLETQSRNRARDAFVQTEFVESGRVVVGFVVRFFVA